MGMIVVTGSASGIGAACRARLIADGHDVIGVDLRDADVLADLSTGDGRRHALEHITQPLDGVVTCAGLGGATDRAGSLLIGVNYFGTVDLITGLRPLLQQGSSVVAISSNSTTTQPGVPMDVVDACLAGDEDRARTLADAAGALATYPATKIAVARWIRRNAAEWAGAGIRLNAVAPGYVETAMTDELRADPVIGPAMDAFPIPVGRKGRPEDVAALVVFLLGPDAGYICGSIIFVDGGTDALLRTDDWPAPWDLDLGDAATLFGVEPG